MPELPQASTLRRRQSARQTAGNVKKFIRKRGIAQATQGKHAVDTAQMWNLLAPPAGTVTDSETVNPSTLASYHPFNKAPPLVEKDASALPVQRLVCVIRTHMHNR